MHIKQIGIVAEWYIAEKPERFESIEMNNLVHHERYDRMKQSLA
ncbi:MAG TPA: hypothetical protein VE130_04590 [Nitrososphaeraceae archaeon]|jgi:hypothetical protein|nr:hypothetical protein [Nitrososphaeraceae archaeon]